MENQLQQKKPIWKRWWFWAIILVIIVSVSNGGNKSQPAQTANNKKETKQQAVQEKPFNWPKEDITVETVKLALKQKAPASPVSKDLRFPKNITDIIILNSNNPGHKIVTIYYKSGPYWDETDLVRRSGGTAIEVGSLLFLNPKIDQVSLFALVKMRDQYGNEKLDVGTKIILKKDMAIKANWKGLAEIHELDPTNIYKIAAEYYIDPGILKNVEFELY
jgi:hypothetical protein